MNLFRLSTFLSLILFLGIVPVWLIAINVRLVVNLPYLYSYSFDKYQSDIVRYIDIHRSEYLNVSEQIRDYFNNDQEHINVTAVLRGTETALFEDREISHMRDVKLLVSGVYRITEIAPVYILAFLIFRFLVSKKLQWFQLGQYVKYAGWLTLAVMILTGFAVLVGFERLFLAFHLVSFSNDLWILDPRYHNLIAMYPSGFFFDTTVIIALLTVLEATLLVTIPVTIQSLRGRLGKQ